MSQATVKKTAFFSIGMMTKVAMLAAVAGVLMLFEMPLGFAPSFYKLDLSEVPVLIGALALGPWAGVVIELLKIMLNFVLNGTITGGVGEAANLVVGCAFVVPIALIYSKNKTTKGMLLGCLVGIIVLGIVGVFANYLVLLPVYSAVYGLPLEAFVEMGHLINPAIVDLKTLTLWAILPFNLVKGIIISVLTFFLYRRVGKVLEKRS